MQKPGKAWFVDLLGINGRDEIILDLVTYIEKCQVGEKLQPGERPIGTQVSEVEHHKTTFIMHMDMLTLNPNCFGKEQASASKVGRRS